MSLSPLYLDLTIDLHVRTAFERPPRFLLASFGPGKARYLSGPSEYALLQIHFIKDQDRALLLLLVPRKGVPPNSSQVVTFIARRLVSITKTLAYSVDSLVRVSRRLTEDRVALINPSVPAETASSNRLQLRSIYLPRRPGKNP